jgi:DNA-binding CsgD family transcriptional regulator
LAPALVYVGAYEAGAKRFEDCVALAQDVDPSFAVRTSHAYAWLSWLLVGPSKAFSITARAREMARSCDEPIRRLADAAWGRTALETGNPQGLDLTETAAREVETDPLSVSADVSSSWGALVTYGEAAKYVERLVDSERVYRLALTAAEKLGIADEQAFIAIACADALIRRLCLDDALQLIERCAKLSDLAPLAEPFAGVGRALVFLLMGRLEESEGVRSQVEPVVTALGIWSASLWLSYTRAWRLLSEGRLAEACELYAEMEATTSKVGIGEPCVVPWAGHAIAAYIGCGREDDARRLITWLEESSERLPCRWPRIAAARGGARLAEAAGDHAAAETLFGRALELHDGVDLPLERFQTLLEHGRFLRRAGQPGRARPLLAEALGLAEASGADWLASQARDELRVAGGRRRRRDEQPGRLTAQERRVAESAARGATNPEIARQLYLSVSTVETHLEHVYAKLGIRSRRELMTGGALDEAKK